MIHPDTPPALADALRTMEAVVDSRVQSITFAAPELIPLHVGELKQELAGLMEELYESSEDD